jgi:hypothetical protein
MKLGKLLSPVLERKGDLLTKYRETMVRRDKVSIYNPLTLLTRYFVNSYPFGSRTAENSFSRSCEGEVVEVGLIQPGESQRGVCEGGIMVQEKIKLLRAAYRRFSVDLQLGGGDQAVRQVKIISPQGRRVPRGRIVVEEGERIWECRVWESRHLYHALDAWTISETILTQLQALGVDRIRFVVVDQDRESYEITLEEFLARAAPLDQSGWTKRTEEQYALSRRLWFWKKRESAARQLQLEL